MEKKTESNYLKNKNLVLLIPAILVINTVYSFIFFDGLGINNLFEFSTFLVFLSKINPLVIPVHLATNLISMDWMWAFLNPQRFIHGYFGFEGGSIFNLFSLLLFSYPRIFLIPILLFLGWPILALTMIKRVQSEAEPIPTGLTISEIIKNSFSLGLNNKGLIIGASILWALTAWIPYLNVGTTIGFLGIIVSISKGDSVSATEICNSAELLLSLGSSSAVTESSPFSVNLTALLNKFVRIC